MTPFVAAQVHSIVESIRLIEVFVTAPLGLYSDIKMLRESLELPEAAELPRSETQERRSAYKSLSDDPGRTALQTIELFRTTLSTLDTLRADGSPLRAEWVAQAHRVLSRAEQKVGGELRAETASRVTGLYVIVDPEATRGRPVSDVAAATLDGGASVLQLRDKSGDKADVLATARVLKSMSDDHGALFIVNDDPGIALSSDAHGLHVGRGDMPVAEARGTIATGQILGRSNNSIEEVVDSQQAGVDYVAVGAVFSTSTMGKSARPAIGVEAIEKVKGMVDQPVVAIGGINESNVAEVVRAGADCVCVVSAVTLADDPKAATSNLVEAIQHAKS